MAERNLEDWLDSYIHYCHDSEPQLKYHQWCGVSVMASALQRKCRLSWGSLTFYPNFYIALVGPPGKARKGTAMDFARSFVDDLNVPMAADANSRQALIRRMKECTDVSVGSRDDCYMETHSSLTVFSPELTVFLGYANKELMSDLCDLYDCRKKFEYDTIARGSEEIISPFLNIIGATTPELLQLTLPEQSVGSGLPSRIIFVYEHGIRRRVVCPFFTESPEGKELRKNLLEDLHKVKALTGNFKVTREFVNRWADFYGNYPETCPFDPQRFGFYWERRPGHIMKLSMIMSASRTDRMLITEDDLNRAITFITETERKMPYTFAGMGRVDKADVINRVMSFIARKKEVKFDVLMSEFYRDLERFEMDQIIGTLRSMKFISVTEKLGTTLIKHLSAKPSLHNMKEDNDKEDS